MNVRDVIEALIGLDPSAEVEVADDNHNSTSIVGIKHTVMNGSTYVVATIDPRSTIEDRP